MVVFVDERGSEARAGAPTLRPGTVTPVGGAGHGAARISVAEAAGVLRAAGLEVSTDIRQGDPVDELLAAADAWGADCIVTGSHGLNRARHAGAPRASLGAVAGALAQRAPFSIEVVRRRPAFAARAAFP